MAFERDEDGRRAAGCDGSTCAEDNRRAVELRILAIAHHGARLFQLKSGLTSAPLCASSITPAPRPAISICLSPLVTPSLPSSSYCISGFWPVHGGYNGEHFRHPPVAARVFLFPVWSADTERTRF